MALYLFLTYFNLSLCLWSSNYLFCYKMPVIKDLYKGLE